MTYWGTYKENIQDLITETKRRRNLNLKTIRLCEDAELKKILEEEVRKDNEFISKLKGQL